MNGSLHIADTDLTLYALGALPASEMNSLRAHFMLCAKCKEELRQVTLALAAYAETVPQSEPPAGARERFVARLNAQSQARISEPNRRQQPFYLWRKSALAWFESGRWTGALAGALALLLIVVGIDDLRRRAQLVPLATQAHRGEIDSAQLSQLMELLTTTNAQKVSLHEAPVASPPPEGKVVYSAHSGSLLLTASNLKPLPSGKTYELWILQGNGAKPLPAGVFTPDTRGNAALVLPQVPANLTVVGFGVTIEKAGGSDVPTPPIVLSGQ